MEENNGRKMVHILVVEDDEKLNRIVCMYLKDSGFEVKGCLNARDAYDEMYNQIYDLIISDIMMPEIDGFEFAQTVRKVNKEFRFFSCPPRMICRPSRRDSGWESTTTW